jgi:hypothetical protein
LCHAALPPTRGRARKVTPAHRDDEDTVIAAGPKIKSLSREGWRDLSAAMKVRPALPKQRQIGERRDPGSMGPRRSALTTTGACWSTRRSLLERHSPVGEGPMTLEQTPASRDDKRARRGPRFGKRPRRLGPTTPPREGTRDRATSEALQGLRGALPSLRTAGTYTRAHAQSGAAEDRPQTWEKPRPGAWRRPARKSVLAPFSALRNCEQRERERER